MKSLRLFLMFSLILLAAEAGLGQSITNYAFSASSGTFTPLSGGTNPTNTGGLDLGYYNAVPIGFTFIYMGVPYTTCAASTDGALVLGGTLSGGLTTNNLLTGTPRPLLAPLWDDNALTATTDFTYQTSGTPGSRIFTAEWLNVKWNYNATAGCMSFQVKLYEATGAVEFVYHQLAGTLNSASASIGISAVGTGSGNMLSLNGSGASPTVSSTTETTTIAAKPAEGQIYTFTPPALPEDPTTLTFSAIGAGTITVNWVDNSTSEFGFVVTRATDPGFTTNVVTTNVTSTTSAGTGTAYNSVQVGMNPTTTYYFKIQSMNEGSLSAGLTGNQATGACSLSGTYTVGSGGNYASLTAAMSALNSNGLTGPVILELLSTYPTGVTETYPIVINNLPCISATNTLTIRPQTGATGLVISSANATATIDVNGGDYITIDGRPGGSGTNQLTITNTALGSATAVRFIGDATYNTIQYCTLRGSAATSQGVVTFATGTTTGNDFNTISNCNITAAGTNLPLNAIYSMGSSASIDNSDINISNNNIYDYFSAGSSSSGINVNSFNSGWTITGNSFYQTASRTSSASNFHYGIFISNTGSGYVITNNYIGGGAASCGGSAWQLLGAFTNRFVGISVSPSSTATTSIQGNTIANFSTNTNSSATTANGNFCGILVSAGNANIGTVTGNTIGSGTGTGSINVNLQSNSGGTANLIAYNGTGLVDIRNNTIGSITLTGATASIGEGFNGIYISGGTPTVMNNSIGSTVTANSINSSTVATSGTQSLRGINITTGVTTGTTINITGNVIANMNQSGTATGSIIQGIYYGGTVFANISSNIVRNITGASTNTTVAGGATAVQGICYTGTSPAGATISLNQVYAIRATNSGAVQTNPSGIGYSNPSNGVITRNLIYDITNASTMAVATTPPTAIGLLIRAALGSGVTISNNMISLGNGQTTNTEFIGINNSFANAGNYIYHNTVNIEGTAAAGALPSFCFLRGDNTAGSAITSNVDLRNNIFNNTRTGGTGNHYAIGNNYGSATSSATGWAAGTSNYNALNGAAAGTVGYWNAAQTLAGWRTASSCDAQSISGPVAFANSATGDLHLNMGITPTQLESGGITGTGITVDYDNQTRPGPAGSVNGGALAPDMGADEFDGVILDLTPPVITYTPLVNTCATGSRTFTATINDLSGVPTSGLGLPVCYWRINAGAYNAATATSLGGNQYQFSIGTGSVTGDVISYYVAAQDNASTPNIGVFPAAGASGFSANPPAVSTSPTTPSSFTNFATLLAGTYSVGAGTVVGEVGHYPTLTAAVNAFNTNCIGGNIVFALTDATYSASETFPITINANPSSDATHTLTIKPDAGVTASISGAVNNNPILRILNNYTIMDGSNSGGTTRDLTLTNTSVTGPNVLLVGSTGTTPITNVTVKNSIILNGANTSSAIVTSDAATIGNPGYFNNITYQNNSIQRAYIGLYNNAVVAAGNGNVNIISNDLSTSGANAIRLCGLYVQGTDAASITGNTIGNFETASAENDVAIWLATGVGNTMVSNNTISNMSHTATGSNAPFGIRESSGLVSSGNTISGNTLSNITTTGTAAVIGIDNSGGGTIIEKNNVSGVLNNSTSTYGAYGINISGGNNTIIRNNFVSNVNHDMTGGTAFSTTFGVFGIRIASGTGHKAYHNSVNLYGLMPGTATASQLTSAFCMVSTASTGCDVRNNIFANNITGGTTSIAHVSVCLPSGGTSSMNLTWNNNAYYYGTDAARQGVGQAGTTAGTNFYTTLPALTAYTNTLGVASNDNKSYAFTSGAPFNSATNLHLDNSAGINWCLNGAGASVGVTTDIDNDVRGVLPYGPDLGADEFTAAGLVINNPAAVCAPTTVDLTAAAVTSGSIGGLTFTYWTDAAATSALASPGAVTVSGTYYIKALNGTCTMTLPVVVVVNAQPVAFNVTGGGAYCNGGAGVLVGLSGSETGVDYQLYNGATAVGSAVAGTGSSISFGNQTTAGTYTVVATNATTSCTNTMTGSVDVIVNPVPTVNAVSNQVLCNGASTIAVTFSGAVPGTVYNWTNDNTTIGLAASGSGDIASFTAANATNAPVVATVTVTPSYTNAGVTCTGTPITFTITVNPTPTVNAVSNQVLCNGANTTAVTFSGAVAGTVYNWTNNTPSIGLAASGTGNIGSFVATNATTAPVVATVTVTPSYTNAGVTCTGTPITFTYTVNPTPTVNSVSNQVLCNGANTTAVTFSGAVAGTVYNWTNNTTSIGLAASGTGNIASFVATNATTAPVVATVTVTPSYTNAGVTCTGTPITFTYTVNPTPTVNSVSNQVLCNGANTTAVTFSGAVTGTVYNWTNNTPSIGLAATGTGNIGSFVATNATTAPVVATVTVTPSYTNAGVTCTGTPITFTYTVNPTPTVNSVSNQVLCNGANTTAVTFSGAVTGTVYNWTNSTPSIGLAASGTGNIGSFVATNATTAPVVATVTVTPSYTNAGVTCTGTPITFTYTVNPTPTVNSVTNQVLCNGASTTAVTFSGAVTGTVYNWTNNTPSIGLAASGSGDIASFTATNATTAPVVATVTVTPSYTNAGVTCTGTPITFTYTVNPTPTVNSVTNQVLCNGANTTAVTFSGAVTGTVYNWTNDTPSIGLAASGSGDIASFTATNATTAPVVATVTVTPSYTNAGVTCTGTPITFTITVNPTPTVNSVSNQVLCNGANTTAVTFSGAVAGTVYNWTNNTPSIGLAASGTGNIGSFVATNAGAVPVVATITVTPAYTNAGVTCTGTPITYTYTVNPQPAISSVLTQPTTCVSADGAIAITVSGGSGSYSFNWSTIGGSGLIAGNEDQTGLTVGFYTVIVTDIITSCQQTANFSLVGPGGCGICPTIGSLTTNPSGAFCAGSTVTITASGLTNMGVSYGIDFISSSTILANPYAGGTVIASVPNGSLTGGGTIATTNVVLPTAGTFYLYAILSPIPIDPLCRPYGQTSIIVNPIPDVNSVSNQVLCNGANTTAVTFSGAVTGTVYNWTNNTPSIGLAASGTGNIGSFVATNATTAPVVATVTVTPSYTNAGVTCTGTPITFTYTVNPTPTVNSVANQVLCNGANTTAVTFSGAVTGTVYNWTNNTPSIGLAASGTGNIGSFVATNATTAPVVATVTVTPSYTNAGVTCTGAPITFTYTVNPTATVNAVANQVLCNGANTTAVTFSSPTTGGTIVYNWTNSTPSIGLAASGTGNIGSFVATNATTAPVVATVTVTPSYTNAGVTCIGTPITFTYTVNPTATVNAVANQVLCNGANTTAVTFSSPTTGGTIVYNWTNNTPSIGLAASGTGNIGSFVAANATNAPVVATVTVTPSYTNAGVTCIGTPITFTYTVNPTATVNAVANQVLCNGANTTAVTFSSPTTGGTIVYNWTNNTPSIGLAASGTGNIASFVATNATTAPVVATVTVTPSYTNAGVTCIGTPLSYTYTVNPTPIVNAVANQVLCNGANTTAVTFTTPTTGGTMVYNWTNNTPSIGLAASGSGNIASFVAVNATNAPVVATVTVTPQYTNAGVTCTGAPITFTYTVNPTPIVNAVANQVLCNGANTTAVTFSSPTTGGTIVYNWTNNTPSIGLAASGTGNIGSFVAVNATNAPVVATITVTPSYTNAGVTCTGAPITFTYTVNPTPVVNAVVNQVLCNGANTTAVTFSSPTTGGTLVYNWTNNTPSIGLAASGTGNIGSFVAVNATNAPVVATVTVTPEYTNAGVTCTGAPISFTITVNPTPTVDAVANQELCNGENTTAVIFSGYVPGTVYNWTNSTPSIGLAASGTGDIGSFTAINNTNVSVVATITVTPSYTNAGVTCTGAPISFTITVNPTPVPTINGPDEVCAGTEDVVYTTEPGYTGYTWSVSNGGIITGGNSTNTVTVNWTAAGNKFIAVDYYNADGCNALTPTIKYVTVHNLPAPMVFGEDTLCSGTHNVQYTTQANYYNYNWVVSSGGSIVSGQGTKTILVNWDGSGSQSVSVNYETSYGCEAENPFVLGVYVTPKPATAGVVSGPTHVCVPMSGVVYSVSAIADADEYFWTLPAGATIVSGEGTNSITVDFAANAVSGVIKVFGSNECGNGGSSPNLNVTVATIPATPTITYHGDTLTSSSPTGNQWYKDGVAIAGATGQNYVTTEIGTYTVIVTINGCSSEESEPFIITSNSGNMNELNTMLIQPNPNTGKFKLTADIARRQICTLEIITNTGVTIYKEEGLVVDGKFSKEVDITGTPVGLYMVVLRNAENQVIRKMIVTH